MDQHLRRSYFGSFPQTILIVDHPLQAEKLVRAGILACGVQVEFFETKSEAIKAIEHDSPDLVVSSLEYRDGTAVELVNEMHAKVGAIPSIFLTESSQGEIQKQVLKLGAFDILQRPFEMLELIRRIDRAAKHTRGLGKKTRIESFLEYQKLIDESKSRGILVSELINLKDSA